MVRVDASESHPLRCSYATCNICQLLRVRGDAFAVVAYIDVHPDWNLAGPGTGVHFVQSVDMSWMVREESESAFTELAGESGQTRDRR